MPQPIRVGIIGLGGWARYGHLPALRSLPQLEVAAVASRTLSLARSLAETHAINRAFDDPQDLIDDPDIDLVAVLTPGPSHAPLVRAAVQAGKDVYCEWPLTTTTAESEELAGLADAQAIRHVVGLQRRRGPSARYALDLLEQGFVGEVRSARMSIGTDGFGPVRGDDLEWTVDPASFSHLLSIYGGHFMDLLFHLVGPPAAVSASARNQFPDIHLTDSGRTVASSGLDDVVVSGRLERGGLFDVQLQGGQPFPTGLQLEVSGTEGFLRLSNVQTFTTVDNTVVGARRGDAGPATMPVPENYRTGVDPSLTQAVGDLAHLYAAYAADRATGSTEATTFHDAVRQHRIIDRVVHGASAPKS